MVAWRDEKADHRAGKQLGIAVHDHISIGKKKNASLKGLRLICRGRSVHATRMLELLRSCGHALL